MAEIKRFILFNHIRADASRHVVRFSGGEVIASGRGLSFWFMPLNTSLVEIPIDDRELPFIFHARSYDYQDVSVQGVINLRVNDPQKLSEHVDFSIDARSGAYTEQPLEKLAALITELAQQFTADYLTQHVLKEILDSGFDTVRTRIYEGLHTDPGVTALGVSISSVRIIAIRPEKEVEKALQTPAREAIQQQADEASFSRRAMAVEKERAIAENELHNQIELARREADLIKQRGDNELHRVTDEAEAGRIEAEAKAERTTIMSGAEADRIQRTESARVQSEAERMAIYRDYPAPILTALAVQNLAANMPAIEHLNITPDLVGEFINRFVTDATARLDP